MFRVDHHSAFLFHHQGLLGSMVPSDLGDDDDVLAPRNKQQGRQKVPKKLPRVLGKAKKRSSMGGMHRRRNKRSP